MRHKKLIAQLADAHSARKLRMETPPSFCVRENSIFSEVSDFNSLPVETPAYRNLYFFDEDRTFSHVIRFPTTARPTV